MTQAMKTTTAEAVASRSIVIEVDFQRPLSMVCLMIHVVIPIVAL